MSDIVWKKLLGGAKVVLGAAFVYEGGKMLLGESAGSSVAPLEKPIAGVERVTGGSEILKTSKIISIKNGDINKRIAYIQEKTTNGSLSPRIKELVSKILSQKCDDRWCVKEKDYKGEIEALFWALKDVRSPNAIRYQRDHAYVDQFTAAEKTLALKAGDCDDDTILLGCMLLCAGYPVKLRVIMTSGSWSHIYFKVGTPPTDPTRWISLDLTVDKDPGWEVPGAEDVALTGVAGDPVEKVKDYTLWNQKYLRMK